MYSINSKRRSTGRISVWVLVFALMLTFVTATLILPASASNFTEGAGNAARDMGNAIGDAANSVGDGLGEAVSDVGDGVGEAVSDMAGSANDGKVNDTDGIIGNSDDGADKDMTSGNTAENNESNENNDAKKGGWIALAIAIVVIVAVVVLVIVLIPKKKGNES